MDALGARHVMPTFEVFCDHLTHEQAKLKQLDSLSGSQNQALVAESSKGKQKQKPKPKKDSGASENPSKPPPKSDSKPQSNSKQGKSSKSGESSSKTKKKFGDPCSFCGKEGHPVSRCWKHLEALEESMQQHNISAPQPPSPPTGKGHALSA